MRLGSRPRRAERPGNRWSALVTQGWGAVGVLAIGIGVHIFPIVLAIIFPEMLRSTGGINTETTLSVFLRLLADISVIAFSWAGAAFARNSRWNLTLACGLAFNGTVIILFLVLILFHFGI